MNVAGILAGGLQPLVDRDALRLELLHRVLHAGLQVGLTIDSGGSMSTSPASDAVVRSMNWLRAWLSLPVPMRSARGCRATPRPCRTRRGSRRPTRRSARAGPLSCTVGRVDGEVGRLAGAVRRGGEVQLVAGVAPSSSPSKPGCDPAAADLVEPVLGVQPGDRLAVARCRSVERDLVAGLDGRSTSASEPWRRSSAFDRLVDIVLVSLRAMGSSTRRPP